MGQAAIYAKRNREALIGRFLKASIKGRSLGGGGATQRRTSVVSSLCKEPNKSNLQTFSDKLSRRTFVAEVSGAGLMDRLCRPCGVVQLFFS